MTRKQKLDKRKGKYGSGWGESKKHREFDSRVLSGERWVVEMPGDRPHQAFFNENRATEVATAVANFIGSGVPVTRQIRDENGNWIES